MILLKNISKSFGNQKILDNISLNIMNGDFVSIVGPSGAGKTTLINILGTIESFDDNKNSEFRIDDIDICNLKENEISKFRNKNIGFVFQAYNLIPVLSARENIEMIMLLQGADEKVRKERTDELLNQVGLYEMRNRRPSELSGGQQQRVAVARALASKPKFILADEPTANLDTSSTSNLLDIMSKLNENEKITFIFSTHDQRVIDRARRVLTLEDGKIVSDKKK